MAVFFFKRKTAYEMRISDWSSDVCSSDLDHVVAAKAAFGSCRWLVDTLCPRFGIESTVVDGRDRKRVVSGKSVSVRVDLGGRRIIKQKKHTLNVGAQQCSQHSSSTIEI